MERVKNNFYDVENNKTSFHLASLDTITLFTEKIDCSVSSTPLHQRKCIRRVHSRQTHSYLLLRPRAMNRIELEAVSYVGSLVFEKRNRSLDRACTSRPCECQTFQSRPDRMKYRFRLMYLYTIRKKMKTTGMSCLVTGTPSDEQPETCRGIDSDTSGVDLPFGYVL